MVDLQLLFLTYWRRVPVCVITIAFVLAPQLFTIAFVSIRYPGLFFSSNAANRALDSPSELSSFGGGADDCEKSPQPLQHHSVPDVSAAVPGAWGS